MYTFRGSLTIGVLLILTAGQAFSLPFQAKSNSRLIQEKIERLRDYERDFLDFAKSGNSDDCLRYDVAIDLKNVASETSEYLDAANTLLLVYDSITNAADRATVKPIIETQLSR